MLNQNNFLLPLTSVLLMSFVPVFFSVLLGGHSPFTVVFLSSLANIVGSLLFTYTKIVKVNLFKSAPMFLVSFLNNGGTIFQAIALKRVNPGMASILGRSYLIYTTGFSYFLLKEKLPKLFIPATLLYFFGIYLIFKDQASYSEISGCLAVLIQTFCFATANFLMAKNNLTCNADLVLFTSSLISLILALLVYLTTDLNFTLFPDNTVFILLGCVVFNYIGTRLFYQSYRLLPFSSASMIRSLSPVLTLIHSSIFFSFDWNSAKVSGVLFALASSIAVLGFRSRKV